MLIIDPITSQKMRSWFGMVQPESLLDAILLYSNDNSTNYTHCLSSTAQKTIKKKKDKDKWTFLQEKLILRLQLL